MHCKSRKTNVYRWIKLYGICHDSSFLLFIIVYSPLSYKYTLPRPLFILAPFPSNEQRSDTLELHCLCDKVFEARIWPHNTSAQDLISILDIWSLFRWQ